MNKKEDVDSTPEVVTRTEDDMSEDNSDNDSVDSAQLLADITDVLNSSDLDFPGAKKSESNITVSYLNKSHSVSETLAETPGKHKVIKDGSVSQSLEKQVSVRSNIANSHSDRKVSIQSEKSLTTHEKNVASVSCVSDKHQDTEYLRQGIDTHNLKEPLVCLTKLDPNQVLYKVQSLDRLTGQAQSVSVKVDMSVGDGSKARKKIEIKKSAWNEEDSPLSNISVSDVSDPEDDTKASTTVPGPGDPSMKTGEHKSKGIKDEISKAQGKTPKLNTSRHKVTDKDIVVEEKGVATPSSSLKAKTDHSNQATSLSQSKKNTTPGVKTGNPIDKSKANESFKSTDKDRKVTDKPKIVLTDSRKRRLSKDDKGIDTSSPSSCKHQKPTSGGKKNVDHVNVSLPKDKTPKLSSVETKKTVGGTKLSNWRYELQLSPVHIDDLSNESFRKFINLASDCAINVNTSDKAQSIDGNVNLYFGTASQMQSGMQKLCQLPLVPPKILDGTIKCHRMKQVASGESNLKWTSAEEVKLGFSMFSTWTEKVKQLVHVKDWKREDVTKRKFAQIQRIPPIVSKEMISLLFPFSCTVHFPKPNASDQKKDSSSGHTLVQFENNAWMESVLSCFRDLYVAKRGDGNPVWKLKIMNFTPRPEKIPVRPVSATRHATITRNVRGPKTASDSTPKDKLKDFTKLKHNSDSNQSRTTKETPRSDENRKRPYISSSDVASQGGVAEKKRRPSEGTSKISPEEASSKSASSNLKTLAQSKGLDPTNIDVLRILEMQNQLTSLQALFSCTSEEDDADLGRDKGHDPEKSQGHRKRNVQRDNIVTANPNSSSISEAERQLRDNIANKQRQLRVLEEKLQQKRKGPIQDNPPTPMEGSNANIAASLNNEPLDFTKPAPKIEEAVKKDEERSKMFASNISTSSNSSYHSKGKKDSARESTFKAEDFALPLQFGKNVNKAAINEIAHKSEKQTREKNDYRQSTNRSGHRKSLNEQHSSSKPAIKDRSPIASCNQQKWRNFESGKYDERKQVHSKEGDILRGEGQSMSRGNRFQESFKPGNRIHQSFGGSSNENFGMKANVFQERRGNDRYQGEERMSHMAHEKTWEENSHSGARQMPDRDVHASPERRRDLSQRNIWDEAEGPNYERTDAPFQGNRQDNVHFFREDAPHEKYSPMRKSSELAASSQSNEKPLGARESPRRFYERQIEQEMVKERNFGNAWTARGGYADGKDVGYSERHQHGAFERNDVIDQGYGFQEQNLRDQGNSMRGRGMISRGKGGTDTRGRGHELLKGVSAGQRVTEDQRERGEVGRGAGAPRGFGIRGRGPEPQIGAAAWGRNLEFERGKAVGGSGIGMLGSGLGPLRGAASGIRFTEAERDQSVGMMRGRRDTEFERDKAIGREDTEPPRSFGKRGRGNEHHRGGGGRGSGFGRDGALGEQDIKRPGDIGLWGKGHETQRGAASGGRGGEFEKDEDVREKYVEHPRGFGMKGRGHEPQRGAAGGRDEEPSGGFGSRGRDLGPQRGALDGGRGSSGLGKRGNVGGRDAEPPAGFSLRGRDDGSQRGAAVRGRDVGPQRSFNPMGLEYESDTGRSMDEREYPGGSAGRGRSLLPSRGRGTQVQRDIGYGENKIDSQDVNDMKPFRAGYGDEWNNRPVTAIGMRGRENEIQRNEEMMENSFETARSYGVGRGRGMAKIPGTVGRSVEHQREEEIGGRVFESGRGTRGRGRGGQGLLGTGPAGTVGRSVEHQREDEIGGSFFGGGRGTRGRGQGGQGLLGTVPSRRAEEIQRGTDVDGGKLNMGGTGPGMNQIGRGMQGRGGRDGPGLLGAGPSRRDEVMQRGTEVDDGNLNMGCTGPGMSQIGHEMQGRGGASQRGCGRGLDSQRGSMTQRGTKFEGRSNFFEDREEHRSFREFGSSEQEGFHNETNRSQSFASIPVERSSSIRGRGPSAEWQQKQMSQTGGVGYDKTDKADRFKQFAKSVSDQEISPLIRSQGMGNNRGGGRPNMQEGFEHRQSGMQEANSSMNMSGSATGTQRGNGRGTGFGNPPRGRGMPRGRGFGGPPVPSSGSSDNFGGNLFKPQGGHELHGASRGTFNFQARQNDNSRGRGGPVNNGRGGRNMLSW